MGMKEKAKEREGRKNPAKQRRDCITQSKQAQAEARAPSPAQGLFRLGKNQSSGTKVIDRSDLHTHTHSHSILDGTCAWALQLLRPIIRIQSN